MRGPNSGQNAYIRAQLSNHLFSNFVMCKKHFPDTYTLIATVGHVPEIMTSRGVLSREQIAKQKQNVSWSFGEPPHEPRKPKVSIRNQHARAVPFLAALELQHSLNPIDHLKFTALSF